LEANRDLLRQGAVLIDPSNRTDEPRLLFYVLSDITDDRPASRNSSDKRTLSRRLQFVELTQSGELHHAGSAPYLDYECPVDDDQEAIEAAMEGAWLVDDLEGKAKSYAIRELVPEHLTEVRKRREHLLDKTRDQVHERLKREISHWDSRATELELKERAGKAPKKLNSEVARRRSIALAERLKTRMEEIEQQKQIAALPPILAGGALILPEALVRKKAKLPTTSAVVREAPPETTYGAPSRIEDTKTSELLAMAAVMEHERSLGNDPKDIGHENRGYDIESRDGTTGTLRFLEVKGRHPSAQHITITRNEMICALNNPEQWLLAYVEVADGKAGDPIYRSNPFGDDGLPFSASTFNVQIADLRGIS